jgi:hypothetical protein
MPFLLAELFKILLLTLITKPLINLKDLSRWSFRQYSL